MPLLHDGKFTISLYHGTNLLFYDSIKQHGLGGRNVIAELRVIELLRELIAICKRSLPPSDELNAEMCVADLIASQCVHAKGYNWRHGTAYLSATVDKGVRYAATSEFGSEALTCFMRLWMWLHATRVDLPANVTVACEPIVKFASGMKKPLLFQFFSVAVDSLVAEDGSDPNMLVNEIENFESEESFIFQHFLGGLNFEVRQPISISNAKVFRIVRDRSDGYAEEFSLVPLL